MAHAGLYIHVPFCTSVCPYCDFAVTIAGDERRDGYLHALEREIALAGRHGLSFDTIYFGGGTPSSLSPDQLASILDDVTRELDITSDAILHLEINPEDVNRHNTNAWKGLGFSFASLGVQSFDDEALAFLGRRHDAKKARRSVEDLVNAGFETVSVDLIFGLPDQGRSEWEHQLKTALDLRVHHMSCYQLTIHSGTVFGRRGGRGELGEAPEDDQAGLFLLTHNVLETADWQGYEVSNFAATQSHRSKHNQKYWDHTPYIGLGPSAHSYDGRRRWWNQRKLRLWAASLQEESSPIEGFEELTDTEMFFESVMLGLRTADGIDIEGLRHRFGPEIAVFNDAAIQRLIGSGHLRCDGYRLRPTATGLAVSEGLVKTIL